uniref:Uncharacterized protein n=1 Tax=Arundo donax TaxID=35708 RepID=A0A0A9AEC6_ARUDO
MGRFGELCFSFLFLSVWL